MNDELEANIDNNEDIEVLQAEAAALLKNIEKNNQSFEKEIGRDVAETEKKLNKLEEGLEKYCDSAEAVIGESAEEAEKLVESLNNDFN